MSEFVLTVGGSAYRGWKSLRVSRSIEALSGSFALEFADRWAGNERPWPIHEDDECVVSFDGEPVISGFVEAAQSGFTASMVEGKDRAGDLVDCSAVLEKWEFADTPVLNIARDLCQPFGVGVSLAAGVSLGNVPKKFSVDPGSTAGHALGELCKVAGVLPVSDGRGNVVLTRGASTVCSTALVEGSNIKDGTARRARTGRFAEYRVLGQHRGGDETNGASAACVQGSARDENVRASRVLLVRAEGNVSPAQAKERAQWEATVRAARATTLTVVVYGWTQGDGKLWPLNGLVQVRSPTLHADGEYLISSVAHSLDRASGATTTLTLRPPKAFLLQPTIAPGGQGGDRTWREIRRGV